ncbi:hypothetical protein [Georgenia alba]|uniref:Glycosyl hydrolase family 32 N-terminal domain-containing protein n=1 Tax=Georgenia alba TaxID=2233858 RepID=A0ABW2QBP7_9MICO
MTSWRLVDQRPLFDMLAEARICRGVLGVSDPDVFHADGRWQMLLGAFTTRLTVRIVLARLPVGAPVVEDGWAFVTDRRGHAVTIGSPPRRRSWDGGGMHTPNRVAGTVAGEPVERIYYAGQPAGRTGLGRNRYAIGALVRDAETWRRYDHPVLEGDARRPSAFEPYVLCTDGRWRMWYLSAPGEVEPGERPDYELRYTESDDGLRWEPAETFSSTAEGYFDNTVVRTPAGWRMVLARGTNLHGTEPYPAQGLWLTEAGDLPGGRAAWGGIDRLLDTDASPTPWYAAGLCGPAVVLDGEDTMHVFATGTYARTSWWRTSLSRLRRGRRPPPPSPFYLATGRLTFTRA